MLGEGVGARFYARRVLSILVAKLAPKVTPQATIVAVVVGVAVVAVLIYAANKLR